MKNCSLLIVAGLLVALGCARDREFTPSRSHIVAYRGPTSRMSDVVSAINANNDLIPSLWSRHYFEGDLYDDNGKHLPFINADGILLMLKPGRMRIVGKKITARVFDLGTDSDRFWISAGDETMWWGHNRNIGKPCVQGIPLQPESLLEVLAVSPIDLDFSKSPVPAMRFNPDQDVYMFVWSKPYDGRWIATKEIWYDRKTLHPILVLVFDPDGRPLVRAYLEKHQQIPLDNQPQDHWPWIATSYRLFFPDSGSKITIQLRDMAIENEGAPSKASTSFPAHPGVSKEIQVDQDCKD